VAPLAHYFRAVYYTFLFDTQVGRFWLIFGPVQKVLRFDLYFIHIRFSTRLAQLQVTFLLSHSSWVSARGLLGTNDVEMPGAGRVEVNSRYAPFLGWLQSAR
jgi:hypothetical protein